MAKADPHTQALERFELAAAAVSDQQDREEEDLKFQIPELQWPPEAAAARKGGSIGNVPIPPRPMLSIPKLDQPIQLEINKEKAAHLGVNIHPLSEDADDKTAEKLQEIYRRIEVDSKAHLARSWAFERAVKCGRGFYRILTEYDKAAPKGTKDQVIRIKRLLHQECAFLDPFAEEPDGSDAEWGFIWAEIPFERYKHQPGYKKRKVGPDKYETLEMWSMESSELDALAGLRPNWVKGTGESRMVLVVEYFEVEYDDDGNRSVIWRKLNGIEIIDEQPWPGQYVPIIPVIGKELIPFDSDRRYVGIIGPNKDAQRFFNYNASAVAEVVGQEPKATWLMAEGQEEGHEQEFVMANVRNFPYLRYKPKILDGVQVKEPQRVQADTSKLGMGLQALSMANEFIHAGTFMFEPSLGKQSPNVKTKGATLALQQQGDESNSNWLDNLAQISMPHEACVVLDMMCGDPKTGRVGVYDRKGRIVRTLDAEENHDRVMLNQPYVQRQGKMVPVDPKQPPEGVNPEDIEHYDLTAGAQYMVTTTVGKAKSTRLQAGEEALGQLMSVGDPAMSLIVAPTYLKFRDEPGMQQAAEDMKKFRDHQMPFLADQKEQPDLAQQAQKLAAENQMLKQQMQEMAKALETDKVKVDGQVAQAQLKSKADIEIARMNNATKIAVARITAAKEALDAAKEDYEERLALAADQTHESDENALDRAHEQQMAQAQAQHDAAMGAADAATGADQAAQDRQHEADMGQQGHEQALEQMAAQPQSDNGASA